jgi:hypothetical protein
MEGRVTIISLLLVDDTVHCRKPNVDPEVFFPAKGANASTVAEAKRLCNGWPTSSPCPLRDACREYGVRNQVHGIWGGWADDERKAARKLRRIVPAPLSTGAAYPVRTAS